MIPEKHGERFARSKLISIMVPILVSSCCGGDVILDSVDNYRCMSCRCSCVAFWKMVPLLIGTKKEK